jgi:hypothetical protein
LSRGRTLGFRAAKTLGRAKASYDSIERKPTTRRPEFAVAALSAELLTNQ